MPTYVNRSTASTIIRNTIFHFQKETKVEFYVDLTKFPDLEKISDSPFYDPIINSEEKTAGTEYILVDPFEVSHIVISCISSTPAKIKFNNTSAKEKVIVKDLIITPRSQIKSIIITAGTVFIEEWKTENWNI